MNTNEIRTAFFNFFKSKGHTIIKSSSLVPNDPSILFTIAGMVQFKDVFLGKEKRDYTKAVSSQKCVRAGGKQNDLDDVGYDERHFTFFEMLGNFSFGDYFKEDAVQYAWEFLTKILNLDKSRLYATVYHTDDQAYKIWEEKTDIDNSHIIKISTKDNFWEMGDIGPCGPCSEIFYDMGEHIDGGLPGTPEEDGDRFVELWNVVFMQYEKNADGKQTELPNKNIDTGASLERISAAVQGKESLYEIDLMKNIINAYEKEIGLKMNKENAPSFKILSDHIRTSCFLIADGVMPENVGRGYVLRRIIRRAIRHYNILNINEPLLYKMVDTLIKEMGEAYPELKQAEKTIKSVLKSEEENFLKTLETGLKILEDEIKNLSKGATLSGEIAFKLYDTYGFPIDLTEIILSEKGFCVDKDGFEKAMQEQKERSKENWKGSGDGGTEKIWFDLKNKFGATVFVGYETLESDAQVLAIVKNNTLADELKTGENAWLIFDKTPFYGEKGGQIGDSGMIFKKTDPEKKNIQINDTKIQANDLIIHKIQDANFDLKTNDIVKISIDNNRREAIKKHHSAAHLLQSALKDILGEHVAQKGSWVGECRMRFDFSNPDAMTQEQIDEVEKLVNFYIESSIPVTSKEMPIEEARETGATAMFGEKYGEMVRVVKMGQDGIKIQTPKGKKQFVSIEFCGGTHVKNTRDIGAFKILSESSIAAGVRRIEAACSTEVAFLLKNEEVLLHEIISKLKTSKTDVVTAIEKLQNNNKELQKEITDLKKKIAMGNGVGSNKEETAKKYTLKDGTEILFIPKILNEISPKELKPIAYEILKQNATPSIVLLIAEFEEKISVVSVISEKITKQISAIDIVKKASEILGGKGGGGQPHTAQAGGVDFSKAKEAVKEIENMIKSA